MQKTVTPKVAVPPATTSAPHADGAPAAACYRNPAKATGLRCQACEQPIYAACTTNAPVGHLCPQCQAKRRPVNCKVEPMHLPVAALVYAVGGLLAAALGSLVMADFLGKSHSKGW